MNFADLYLAAIIDNNLPESFTMSPEQAFSIEDMIMYTLEKRAAEKGTLIVNIENLH